MKREIKNGDTIYSTGVHLLRDTKVNGGWVVSSFEDDSYFEGDLVECEIDKSSQEVFYYSEPLTINAKDIKTVAGQMKVELDEEEIQSILDVFPTLEEADPGEYWSTLVAQAISSLVHYKNNPKI